MKMNKEKLRETIRFMISEDLAHGDPEPNGRTAIGVWLLGTKTAGDHELIDSLCDSLCSACNCYPLDIWFYIPVMAKVWEEELYKLKEEKEENDE
jgi:hypothetical protein